MVKRKINTPVCILGDTHFGVRSDSRTFIDFYKKFYGEVFFPYIIEKGIKDIYQLGDLFDRRKYINFLTLEEARAYFFDKLKENDIHLHVLIGNHDIFWRDSLSVNSPNLLLKDYSNITIYENPCTINMHGEDVDIVPWICKENEDEIFQFMKNSKSSICLGHFEITGFQMYKGVESHEGISPDIFKKYSHVFSGHYHHRSSKGNITYVGTPYEHTWADYEDPRGFHIFDPNTKALEFVQNPFKIFHKIYYDDSNVFSPDGDYSFVTGNFIRLIVVNKTNFYGFENFVNMLYEKNPAELKIVEDLSAFDSDEQQDDNIVVEDTMSLLSQYVDSLDVETDKNRIKTLLKSLYIEAQHSKTE